MSAITALCRLGPRTLAPGSGLVNGSAGQLKLDDALAGIRFDGIHWNRF